MVGVISNPCENKFMSAVANANNKIILCAPFIKSNIVSKILKNKPISTDVIVFTNAYIPHYINKSSDIDAIEKLYNSGSTIYCYDNLHAKVYLFDEKYGIVTSGNLTHNGLNINFEYGLEFDDLSIVEQIVNDFNSAMKRKNVCKKMTRDSIDKMKKIIDKNKNAKVYTDDFGDSIFEINDLQDTIDVIMKKPGWKRDILEIIFKIPSINFTLADVNVYISELQKKYPNNNMIAAKVRQVLQQLRDLQLIKFESRGHYKKMFI